MKQRLIVTGFGGFVAGSVVRNAGDAWEMHAFTRRDGLPARPGVRYWSVDLRDVQKLEEAFAAVQPHAVIHAAAIADIDYCQTHQAEAEEINVNVPRALAALCKRYNARLIFCSTDTVFDGRRGMYSESDEPRPVNFYGETKVRAEKAVRDELKNAAVARLSLVFGLPVLGSGNSFLAKMIAALSAGQEVRVPKNEIRSPVDVITVGRSLIELAANDFAGTLHLAGNTRINRYEMAQTIAVQLGYSPDLIVPTDPAAMAGRAARPVDVSLDNARAHGILKTPMRSLMDGLDLIVESQEKHQHGRSTD